MFPWVGVRHHEGLQRCYGPQILPCAGEQPHRREQADVLLYHKTIVERTEKRDLREFFSTREIS